MKILILGDSISEGIGSRKVNFSSYLRSDDREIINMAKTGTTIEYVSEINKTMLELSPDVIIIFYGNVEAIIRPAVSEEKFLYKVLPDRYKKTGMLNPRPYYSNRIFKRFPQKIDSFIRFKLKLLFMRLYGTCNWINEDSFVNTYNDILNDIKDNKTTILLSCVKVDEKYFPGSNESIKRFNRAIRKLAEEHKCYYVDVYSALNEWNDYYDDHYHPNPDGYEVIASLIGEIIGDS